HSLLAALNAASPACTASATRSFASVTKPCALRFTCLPAAFNSLTPSVTFSEISPRNSSPDRGASSSATAAPTPTPRANGKRDPDIFLVFILSFAFSEYHSSIVQCPGNDDRGRS